jgi:hypothetical protein
MVVHEKRGFRQQDYQCQLCSHALHASCRQLCLSDCWRRRKSEEPALQATPCAVSLLCFWNSIVIRIRKLFD